MSQLIFGVRGRQMLFVILSELSEKNNVKKKNLSNALDKKHFYQFYLHRAVHPIKKNCEDNVFDLLNKKIYV